MKFSVGISGGREEQTFVVYDQSHDNTAVAAAEKALETYRRNGLGTFPYNDGPLSITVVPVDEGSVTGR